MLPALSLVYHVYCIYYFRWKNRSRYQLQCQAQELPYQEELPALLLQSQDRNWGGPGASGVYGVCQRRGRERPRGVGLQGEQGPAPPHPGPDPVYWGAAARPLPLLDGALLALLHPGALCAGGGHHCPRRGEYRSVIFMA